MHPLPSSTRGFHAARFTSRVTSSLVVVVVVGYFANMSSASRTVEIFYKIFINRPIRLKKFDPVGGRGD